MQCKQYRMGLLCFLITKTCFLKKNKKKRSIKTKNVSGLIFFEKKNGFFSTLIIPRSFCDFPLITQSGTSNITISLNGCAPHTYSIGLWYLRSWELLAFEYVKNSVDNKTSFEKLNPCCMRKKPYNRKNHLITAFKFCNFTLWMPPCLGCTWPSPRSPPPLCTPLSPSHLIAHPFKL